jgi:hypothetical protein
MPHPLAPASRAPRSPCRGCGSAFELLEQATIDMHGVVAGDLPEMTARARDALLSATAIDDPTGDKR